MRSVGYSASIAPERLAQPRRPQAATVRQWSQYSTLPFNLAVITLFQW